VGIDLDDGRRTLLAGGGTGKPCPSEAPIVVEVSAAVDASTVPAGTPAVLTTRVSVPVSADIETDGVLVVAKASGAAGSTHSVGKMMGQFLG